MFTCLIQRRKECPHRENSFILRILGVDPLVFVLWAFLFFWFHKFAPCLIKLTSCSVFYLPSLVLPFISLPSYNSMKWLRAFSLSAKPITLCHQPFQPIVSLLSNSNCSIICCYQSPLRCQIKPSSAYFISSSHHVQHPRIHWANQKSRTEIEWNATQ